MTQGPGNHQDTGGMWKVGGVGADTRTGKTNGELFRRLMWSLPLPHPHPGCSLAGMAYFPADTS